MGMIARLDQQQSASSSAAATTADNLSAEHKAEHLPEGVAVLPATQQLKLLLTVRTTQPSVRPLLPSHGPPSA